MEIPHRQLSDEALLGVIEEYISREGTDYGHREYSFEEKIEKRGDHGTALETSRARGPRLRRAARRAPWATSARPSTSCSRRRESHGCRHFGRRSILSAAR